MLAPYCVVNFEHGYLHDVARSGLNGVINGLALGAVAYVAVAVVDARDGAYATVERAHVTMFARLFRNIFHVLPHALVCRVVIVNNLLRLFARDAYALRQTERLNRVCDRKIDNLGEAARLL